MPDDKMERLEKVLAYAGGALTLLVILTIAALVAVAMVVMEMRD